MVRRRSVGGLVHHQRRGSAIVKEVDGGGHSIPVGGSEGAGEVRREVDGGAVVGLVLGEDTGDGVHVGLSVVADDDGVDEEGQEGVLVGCGVVLEEGGGVVVAAEGRG